VRVGTQDLRIAATCRRGFIRALCE
jgi:hypothetical protein